MPFELKRYHVLVLPSEPMFRKYHHVAILHSTDPVVSSVSFASSTATHAPCVAYIKAKSGNLLEAEFHFSAILFTLDEVVEFLKAWIPTAGEPIPDNWLTVADR